ncbi:MAG: TIGR04255 family protein [Steroidobacteraceae bacterium]
MSDHAAQPHQFEPIHEAHAIEQAALAIQFSQPIDAIRFKEAVNAFRQRFNQGADPVLPGDQQLQHFAIGFQIGGVGLQQPSQANFGHVFNRTSSSGVIEKELRLDSASIVFRIAVYTRWADMAKEAKKFLDVLLPFYGYPLSIASLGYTVVDKFVWKGLSGQCDPTLLLRPQSKYVCPHVFDVKDMWHSHTGAFIREDAYTKRLLNLNLDCLEEVLPTGDARTVISVTTAVTDSFNQPSYQPLTPVQPQDVTTFVSSKMNTLHSFSKKVFAETVNDATCKRIALVI